MSSSGFDGGLSDAAAFRELSARTLHPIPSESGLDSSPARTALRDTSGGDWDLNPDLGDDPIMQRDARPAAVLLPVVARKELAVLLTLRPEHMKTHAGQISLPGGKLEKHDAGPLGAALRETHEEIGLKRSFIEPLGLLDCYPTASGFDITPVVALIQPGFRLSLDAGEVADAFEVPLQFLMDERNHRQESILWRGKERFFHVITYQERYIWGATAGIIKNLHERLSSR